MGRLTGNRNYGAYRSKGRQNWNKEITSQIINPWTKTTFPPRTRATGYHQPAKHRSPPDTACGQTPQHHPFHGRRHGMARHFTPSGHKRQITISCTKHPTWNDLPNKVRCSPQAYASSISSHPMQPHHRNERGTPPVTNWTLQKNTKTDRKDKSAGCAGLELQRSKCPAPHNTL